MIIVFDLDDTLYNEIDFVKSGFNAVSKLFDLDHTFVYKKLYTIFQNEGSGKVFNTFLSTINSSVSLNECVNTYRNHKPNIKLSSETKSLLESLASRFTLGLLTDGYHVTQKNKFDSLKLNSYFDYVIFSGEFNLCKPDLKLFNMFEKRYPEESKFYYIADNVKKDFVGPNQLGWTSIQILNNKGIYKDEKPSQNGTPVVTLNTINELNDFLLV